MSPACIAQLPGFAMFFSTSALANANIGRASNARPSCRTRPAPDCRRILINVSLLYGGLGSCEGRHRIPARTVCRKPKPQHPCPSKNRSELARAPYAARREVDAATHAISTRRNPFFIALTSNEGQFPAIRAAWRRHVSTPIFGKPLRCQRHVAGHAMAPCCDAAPRISPRSSSLLAQSVSLCLVWGVRAARSRAGLSANARATAQKLQ